MNPVAQLRAIGYEVHLENQEIVCRWQGHGAPVADQVRPLIEELRAHKAEAVEWLHVGDLLPQAISDWPAEWRDSYEERAAIMQFDGGLSCSEAERRAEALVRAAYRRCQ